MRKILKILFLVTFLFSKKIQAQDQEYPKSFSISKKLPNIIFMIGDGMGLSQITAGTYSNGNTSSLEEMSYVGLQKTHAHNRLVTDSAASGTAMACGEKTFNGVIGINSKNKKLESILEYCMTKDYNTALIATSSIVHATPASFYANVISRREYEDIALQLRFHDINYFIGGGQKHFNRRKDKRNLIQEMEGEGYTIVNNINNFKNFNYMDDDIDYFFLVHKETENEEELIDIGEDLMSWQIAIGGIPEAARYELIKRN